MQLTNCFLKAGDIVEVDSPGQEHRMFSSYRLMISPDQGYGLYHDQQIELGYLWDVYPENVVKVWRNPKGYINRPDMDDIIIEQSNKYLIWEKKHGLSGAEGR